MTRTLLKIRKSFENALNMDAKLNLYLSIHKYRDLALSSNEIGIDSTNKAIVSLTTYNKRIFDVYLTIESLFQQTVKPARLLLWLAKDEFREKEIPYILKKQQERGLEMCFCEDIRSYKKLVPTLKLKNVDMPIITVDDDFIYPYDFVERLMYMHQKYPNCVCYYRGARIKMKNDGEVMPYMKWEEDNAEYTPHYLNFATGAGGILYPPFCFYQDVVNDNLFNEYAPTADDIWFKAMTLMNDIKYVKVPIECDFYNKFIALENMQDIALYHRNVVNNENDKQIKDVFEKYGLCSKLKNG